MRLRKSAPKVNAGSMADIAFLLLIFFLVTTTIQSDTGFNRKLPRLCPPGQICDTEINERNILRILINGKQQILVKDNLTDISGLKQQVKSFIDNNGDGSCNYCTGNQLKSASDNPLEAVVSLQTHPQTKYNTFIKVQDEITKAFHELRADYAKKVLGKTIEELSDEEKKQLKDAYPFILSEAQTN